MKNEMFYGRSWQGVTLEEFIQQVNDYMTWYRDTRIKVSLGGMSPAEFRIKMGVTALDAERDDRRSLQQKTPHRHSIKSYNLYGVL